MTVSIVAALVHATSLFFEWWGGFITIEKPRRRPLEEPGMELDRQAYVTYAEGTWRLIPWVY